MRFSFLDELFSKQVEVFSMMHIYKSQPEIIYVYLKYETFLM